MEAAQFTTPRHMPEGKLIRDFIPKIAHERSGDKLVEESLEVSGAVSRAEMEKEIGDVEQVIMTLVEAHGLDRRRIDAVRVQRLIERGGFSKRLLWEPTDGEDSP
jgi:predicted house-cleaning noncanonical NTP pyrophosphatase (MazG superfamily)